MGCLYILGALFYALRVPERFFPGKFDIWVRFIKILINSSMYSKKTLLRLYIYITNIFQI